MSSPNTTIHDILRLCIKLLDEGYAAWFTLTGHVDWIEVQVTKSQTEYTDEYILYKSTHLNPYQCGASRYEKHKLEQIKHNLREILRTGAAIDAYVPE